MGVTGPALIVAAAGVGFGHAVLPDHWAPLAVVARAQRWPQRRLVRTAALAGAAHVAFSLILGAAVIAVGVGFRGVIERRVDLVVGLVLVATGLAFAVVELRGRGHRHGPGGHTHDEHDHGGVAVQSRAARIAAIAVPFGAAASPDLTILPVFLAAGAVGFAPAAGTLVAFATATVATIVLLTVSAALLGYQLRASWIDRAANLLTAAVLLIVGALVAAGVI
jgi:hypothetical protein